ncbi:uncharacterized protein LOC128235636 isoform X2 [Mya arenaria]|uniref:uncharacterized protein LOC128235636 isoform X1 n=1 Tax=Mya arenaria TaxID=6604 RepID=UPI0022DFD03B|nr:uncharacterized protein LOC128235636 isoform X1 [Mya arenaria]XP_052806410.1 uncharacterized protein LOC128235636 isoform X2 [Mya arenaria]
MNVLVLSFISVVVPGVFSQIPTQNILKCRLCNNARTLADCSTLTLCTNQTQECYMEEVITSSSTIVYNGGCRAINRCSTSSTAIGKRQGDLISCSECCKSGHDCNSKMCGIKNPLANSQCYFCDSAHSAQGDVTDPEDCITMTTCDVDQACFGQNKYYPGQPTSFRYGCFNFEICRVMMKNAFDDLARCLAPNATNCGTDHSGICNVCCRGGGCNYGDCHTLRQRLFEEYNRGVFSVDTLKSTPGVTG